jgi:Sigma-70, region 4/Transcription factor WhiB
VDVGGQVGLGSVSQPSRTACATDLELFLHPLLEEPPRQRAVSAKVWDEYQALVARARGACSACPLLVECMYKAVVQADVSGYVGCTTPSERTQMRKALAVEVDAEELDQYAGTRGTRQPVNHEDVLRVRAAYPDDSLEAIAGRLGCSLSTVKRHLRRARKQAGQEQVARADLPTVDAVLDAFEAVVEKVKSPQPG